MSKKRKHKDRLKLPKRLLGVKLPKDTRRRVNGLLKELPSPAAHPAASILVGTVVSALAARLEDPLRGFIETYPKRRGRIPRKSTEATGAPH